MPDQLSRLKRRCENLGNYYRKYLHVIEKDLDGLVERLERRRWADRIHLWVKPEDYRSEMADVAKLGATLEERLADLGCYYALHFLHFNLNALDALLLEVTRSQSRLEIFRQFMLNVGHDSRQLISSYMTQLLNLFLPEDFTGEYVFLGVGTRSDQDDIDIGVVDRGPQDRRTLNKAIARLNAEMLRKAISPHYHISEHVSQEEGYSASIEDFQELLNSEIHDFVIINEMLGSARILGSRKLFSDFRRKITMRYYYDTNTVGPQKFHEGYLRGVIGEIRSLMFKEFSPDRISPKNDGLRMIKAALYAAKTIFNLRQVNAWALLDALQRVDKKRQLQYKKLEISLTYLEAFRFLYQLLVSQEEEIYIEDAATYENLQKVALHMGYERIGVVERVDFFLTDYYNKARLAKITLQSMMPDVIDHLKSITTMGKILYHKRVTTSGKSRIGNLALRFLDEAEFFRGTRFWDDVIEVLAHKDGKVLERLIHDLTTSPQYDELIRRFLQWGMNSFIAFFSLLNLLHRSPMGRKIYSDLLRGFFAQTKETELIQRFSIVFDRVPEIVYEFLSHLPEPQLHQFSHWLDGEFWDHQISAARDRMQFLSRLLYGTSRYLQRLLDKMLRQNPIVFGMIDNEQRMEAYGRGLLTQAEQSRPLSIRLKIIGAYHDFEFFRLGLNLLNGAEPLRTAEEFIYFSDRFIQLLYDTCKLIMDAHDQVPEPTADLAIMVAGGHGHMLAFDDDYDLIILVNSDDEHIKAYWARILARMNREIAKSGVLPHYRLTEAVGSLICTVTQLQDLLSSDREDTFIDASQLLGARMIVGSRILQQHFYQNVLKKYIFAHPRTYIQAMLQELQQRHQVESLQPYNLKEQRGGLRDIEMLLDILRVRFNLVEHSNYLIFKKLQALLPAQATNLHQLSEFYEFIRLLRDLNRLVINADDVLQPEYLPLLLKTWPNTKLGVKTAEELLQRLEKTLQASANIIDQLLQEVLE